MPLAECDSIRVRGAAIRARFVGSQNGTPTVAMHGYPDTLRVFEPLSGGLDLCFQLLFVDPQPFRNRHVRERDHLRGQDTGVRRAWLPDRHGGDRHAGRHLDGRQQRIQPLQGRGVDGDADDRQCRVGGHDAGKMRGRTGSHDEHTHASTVCLVNEPQDTRR